MLQQEPAGPSLGRSELTRRDGKVALTMSLIQSLCVLLDESALYMMKYTWTYRSLRLIST
jgi:hypothetical protein